MNDAPSLNQDTTLELPGRAGPPRKHHGKLARIFVGGIVALAAMMLMYGPANVGQMLLLAVICTAGIGLIPILFVSWMVGWVVFAILDGVAARRGAAATT